MPSRVRKPRRLPPSQRKKRLSQHAARSSITNGRRLLHVDHRTAEMRRLRDCCSGYITQLGGPEAISHAEQVLISRGAMMTVLCEMLEQKFVRQRLVVDADDVNAYQRLTNSMRRLFETLGLRPRPKDVTPDLQEKLARYRRPIEDDDVEDAEVVEEGAATMEEDG